MGVFRRKSPLDLLFAGFNVLAIAICLFVAAEMALAWNNNICHPKDLYIESTQIVKPASCDSKYCTNWCKGLCCSMGTLASQDGCKIVTGNITYCKCCCKTTPPSRCDPPYPLPGPDDFIGPDPQDYQICRPEQTLKKITRKDGKDCMSKSLCKPECSKLGLLVARTECVARSVNETSIHWFEQCCCGTTIHPPRPPCPPPCPPPHSVYPPGSGNASFFGYLKKWSKSTGCTLPPPRP